MNISRGPRSLLSLLILGVLTSLLPGAAAVQADVLITVDDFDSGDLEVTVPGPAPPAQSDASLVSCTVCLGGEREILVNTYESDSMFRDTSASVDTVTGRFFASTEPTVSGDTTVSYGSTADLNLDLTRGGGVAIEVHVSDPAADPDGQIESTFTLTDDLGNTAVGALMLGDISTLTLVELGFSDFMVEPGFDFSDVDRIEIHVNLEDPNQQVDFDSLSVVESDSVGPGRDADPPQSPPIWFPPSIPI